MPRRTIPLADRLPQKIRFAEGDNCWIWSAARTSSGYGGIWLEGRWESAHRVMYQLFRGLIPRQLTIDHLCRNRACVNPNHMELVTRGENVLRGASFSATNARKTHCPQGHEYTTENTGVGGYSRYGRRLRSCKTCRRAQGRAYMARKRGQ